MSIYNNSTDIYNITGSNPNFNWQVGFNTPAAITPNIQFRATVRPINGLEQFTRVPSPTVLYEQTGIIINSVDNLGEWQFTLANNITTTGGPYRNYQVVIEAHDANGNTSAGNIVGTNNESGWTAYSNGYDIIAVQNPRVSGIELSNNIPTQLSGATAYFSVGNNYLSKQYVDSNGNITIQYLTGYFRPDLVGGYIYTSANAFPKMEMLNKNSIYYPRVQRTQFSFNPLSPYIHIPAAAFSSRGAPFIYASISFYDQIDQILINNGVDVTSGLYVSNNAPIFNDSAAGTLTLGGNVTIGSVQTTGYPNPARITGLIGSGAVIIAFNSLSGTVNLPGNVTSIVYLSIPLTGQGYTGFGGGSINPIYGGAGGSSAINFTGYQYGGFSGDTPVAIDANGVSMSNFKPISGLKVGDSIVTWSFDESVPDPNDVIYDPGSDNWRVVIKRFPVAVNTQTGFITAIANQTVTQYYKLTLTGVSMTGPEYLYVDGNQIGVRVQYQFQTGYGTLSGYSFRRFIDIESGIGFGLNFGAGAGVFISGIDLISSPNTMYTIQVSPTRTFFVSGSVAGVPGILCHDSVYTVAGSIYGY